MSDQMQMTAPFFVYHQLLKGVIIMININGIIAKKFTEPEELPNCIGQTVKLQGSIYKIRIMSGFSFVILRTKRLLVQCIYSSEFSGFPIDSLKEEACVIITGDVIAEGCRRRRKYLSA